jgi:hypothetical protein
MRMTINDAKVYAFNATSFMITFTQVEDTLKFALLVASLGYTIHKWYNMVKEGKNE